MAVKFGFCFIKIWGVYRGSMETWKLDKLKAIDDEVKSFHPLLRAIFTYDKTISRFEYTHGQTEMGADFVLARIDQTLGDENYVGVIVKCGNIKQDHSDVKRQIEECTVERFFDGGKKKIYLNETWIVCNGSVSHGAERKIHEEYKSRNIKFIDIDRLSRLVEQNYPHFWNEIPTGLGVYLKNTFAEIIQVESYNTLGFQGGNLDVIQELEEVEGKSVKFTRRGKSNRFALDTALTRNNLIIVEGGMGSGKTTLLRHHMKMLCEPAGFQKERCLPKYIHFSEVADDIENKLFNIIEELVTKLEINNSDKILLILDGVDEVRSTTEKSFVDTLHQIKSFVNQKSNIKIVLGSRNVWTLEEGEDILKYASRFRILPFSFDQIIKVIQKKCESLEISHRLRQDLAKSNLMKVLPRTPMSAILLARILSANVSEIPQTLPELYSKYVELALGRWDIGKGLMTEREYPVVLAVLSRVAKYMLEHELHEIGTQEVLQMLIDYTKTREGLPKPENIFSRIADRSEIVVVNRDQQTFQFRHKSLAEFLLALNQKEHYGRSAPLTNPFEGYWLGVEYFYLGLIQDAGERIDRLSQIVLSDERHLTLRLFNFGNLMLSAYQSEYEHIEFALYKVFTELTSYFLNVRAGKLTSPLSVLPELQFFALLTRTLQDVYGYQYFRKALETAQIQCQLDNSFSEDERIFVSFFIDSVRASFKDPDSFTFLTSKDHKELPWVVKLGICHVQKDNNINLDHIDKLAKKLAKSRKKSPELKKYLYNLYMGSMATDPQKLLK